MGALVRRHQPVFPKENNSIDVRVGMLGDDYVAALTGSVYRSAVIGVLRGMQCKWTYHDSYEQSPRI